MRSDFYNTLAERQAFIDAAESAGETMKNDNFRTGPNGENELVFWIAPVFKPTARDIELSVLKERIKGVPTPVEIARYLVLRDKLDA